MNYHSPEWATSQVLLALALVTATCALARWLLRNRSQPPVIAEILAGFALGPCLLGLLPGDLPSRIFPLESRPFLTVLANVGLVMFMFLVGFEIDKSGIRHMRGSATAVASASALVPFAAGVGLIFWIQPAAGSSSGPASTLLTQALFVGLALSATAFPVLARILDDTPLNLRNIRGLALSAAAAGDVVTWIALAAVVAITRQTGGGSIVVLMTALTVMLLTLHFVVPPLITAVLNGGTTKLKSAHALSVILVGIFICSAATAAMHLHPIFGAFAFGFACPRGVIRSTAPDLPAKLSAASKILMPVFFVLAGLSVSFNGFGMRDVLVTILVIAAASASKVLSVYGVARFSKLSPQDSWGLGWLLNTRGLTELVILDVGLTAGVLSTHMFTVLAAMAIATTLITAPVLDRIYAEDAAIQGWRKWTTRTGRLRSTKVPDDRTVIQPQPQLR